MRGSSIGKNVIENEKERTKAQSMINAINEMKIVFLVV
jgi:hypothetical protein